MIPFLKYFVGLSTTKRQAERLLFLFFEDNSEWCVNHWDMWKKTEDELNYYIWYRWN